MNKQYEAIIFDLGGVLLNIDYNLTADAFKKLGVKDFDIHYSQASQSGLFDNLEKGLITPAEFRLAMRRWLHTDATDEAIDQAWNAMLLDMPGKRLELLKAVSQDYRTFLLSNTNEIHLQTVSLILQKSHGITDFSGILEKQYFSSRMGLRKPDPEIFLHVLRENNLKAENTLFIDDSIQHISGANSIGLNTRHLLPREDILELFPAYLS